MAKVKNQGLIRRDNIQRLGTELSEQAANLFKENVKNNKELAEKFDLKEDNNMSNSGSLYTTAMSKFIFTKEYDKFQNYFNSVLSLTPEDLGEMAGSGAYKIPKMNGAKAAKLSPGEKVEYTNKYKDDVILETESYGIGTAIRRRLIRRGATGFINILMTNASKAVLREVCREIGNSMVAGADSNNTVTGGISVDKIADARKNIESAENPNTKAPFGFYPDKLILTTEGKNVLTKSEDFKKVFIQNISNMNGDEVQTQFRTYDDMEIVDMSLINVKKSDSKVHALLVDSTSYLAYLQETEMEVFDGRIPGTAGDEEIIHALDAGMVVMNAEAASVITE